MSYEQGEYTYGRIAQMGEGGLKIGKFCSIADHCLAVMTGHRRDWFTTFPFGARDTQGWELVNGHAISQPIIIGNDVWIGTGTHIVYGSTIGDGAIITAASLVHGHVPPYTMYGGNPGQFLCNRFNKETTKILLDMKWWDLPIEMIKENYKCLCGSDINKLKEFYEKIKEYRKCQN